MNITQIIIEFPDIELNTRDGHKLRGFFGSLFKEHSPILHNHYADGAVRYAYPLVQYKILDGRPMLVGFQQGADLLASLFLKIRELNIEGKKYPVLAKNIQHIRHELTVNQQLYTYKFQTLWMALNQGNHQRYLQIASSEKDQFLNRQLQNNILSFYKGLSYHTKERVMISAQLTEKQTLFKNQPMIVFSGQFTSNAYLPERSGIGKAVSRGFGTVAFKREIS